MLFQKKVLCPDKNNEKKLFCDQVRNNVPKLNVKISCQMKMILGYSCRPSIQMKWNRMVRITSVIV